MCVSTGPAHFGGVIAAAVEGPDNTRLLGYQNTMATLSGPCCMILHIPMEGILTPGNLVGANLIKSIASCLKDMARPLRPLRASMSMTMGRVDRASFDVPFIVNYGAYELALAAWPGDIVSVLQSDAISPDKRPVVTDRLLATVDFFGRRRRDYCSILACFNNDVELASHPILVKYRPRPQEADKLFVPGLESHTGQPPNEGAPDFTRDYKIVFGSVLAPPTSTAYNVYYSDNLGGLGKYFPAQVVGFHDNGVGSNQDYWAPVEAVRDGTNHEDLFDVTLQRAA